MASMAKNMIVLRRMPTAPKATVQPSAQPSDVSPLVQIAVKSTAALDTSQAEVTTPAEREWAEIPIYTEEAFAPGQGVDGPAIIDESDTTIYVPPGNRIERDEYMNYVLTR